MIKDNSVLHFILVRSKTELLKYGLSNKSQSYEHAFKHKQAMIKINKQVAYKSLPPLDGPPFISYIGEG